MQFTIRQAVLTAISAVLLAAISAPAHDGGSIQHKNDYLRDEVAKQFDNQKAGRDIVRLGTLSDGKEVTNSDVHVYFETMRRWLNPPPLVPVAEVADTSEAPSSSSTTGASSYSGGSSGGSCAGGPTPIPCSIIMCESGGSYTARNPSGAYGRYQIMPGTAAAYGCDLSTAGGQDDCATKVWNGQGRGAWVC